LGVIAQRIQTPPCSDATQTFNFLNSYTPPGGGSPTAIQNTPLSPAASLEIEPNIFADQNLIVGPDFVLTSSPGTTVTITPAPTNNDTTPGNVKIAGDLYVQGNIYSLITSTTPPPPSATLPPNVGTNLWLAISAYVNALVQQGLPEIVVVTQNVQPKNDTTATYSSSYATDTTNIPVKTTRLKSVSTSVVIASFSQIQTTDHATFHSLFGTAAVQLSITTPPTATFTGQNGQIGVTWQAGPASGGPPPTQCAIDNFTVTCVVICFP
jgi:hypothetical protein